MAGLKFRRQQPLGNYIVDFVCFENMLVIELDGGYKVMRFSNHEVMKNLDGVLQTIYA